MAKSGAERQQNKIELRAAQEKLVRDSRARSEQRPAGRREAASRMAQSEGWPRGAVPFIDPPYTPEQLRRADAGGPKAVLQLLDSTVSRRPRDPLAVLEAAHAADALGESGGGRAAACVAALGLVPAGRAYDPERIALRYLAASLEINSFEAGDRSALGRAKRAADAAFALDTADADGELRALKASVLYFGGEYRAAYEAAGPLLNLKKDDPSFAIIHMHLLTLFGEHQVAFNLLRHLVTKCQFENVGFVRKLEALDELAKRDPREWDRLTLPKWTWTLSVRTLRDDDVELVNDSPFALTGVVLKPVIEFAGEKRTLELKADRIEPGKSHVWRNACAVTGGKVDRKSATLACDQDAH